MRITTGILASFIALTAIAGGIAILAGWEDFPLTWLEGTPFKDFTLPALILIFIVGGSALVASITIFKKHRLAKKLAMLAGLVMMGQIITELWILNQEGGAHWIQYFYFSLGLLLFILSLIAHRNK